MHESNTRASNLPESSGFVIEIASSAPLTAERSRMESVSRWILGDHGYHAAEISIAIVDDATIRDLNRRYLNHDYATDVLSFVLDRDEHAGWLHGEVIVSVTTARRVASEYDISTGDEMLLYVIHGLLHLVGWNDQSPDERSRMRTMERRYARRLGVDYVMPAEPEEERDHWE